MRATRDDTCQTLSPGPGTERATQEIQGTVITSSVMTTGSSQSLACELKYLLGCPASEFSGLRLQNWDWGAGERQLLQFTAIMGYVCCQKGNEFPILGSMQAGKVQKRPPFQAFSPPLLLPSLCDCLVTGSPDSGYATRSNRDHLSWPLRIQPIGHSWGPVMDPEQVTQASSFLICPVGT